MLVIWMVVQHAAVPSDLQQEIGGPWVKRQDREGSAEDARALCSLFRSAESE
jgi:hypothetical protein